MIQSVVELRPELNLLALSHGEDLAYAKVEVEQTRSDEHVVSGVAIGIGLRVHESADVEPLVDRLLAGRQVAVSDPVGLVKPCVPVLDESSSI